MDRDCLLAAAPLARGFLARADQTVLERDEQIAASYRSMDAFRALVAELAPVYVAVEKPPLTTAQQPILAMLATHFPNAKVYEDHQVVGYRLTGVP